MVSKQGSQEAVSTTVCGGFRRGKSESGDVDILLCHETSHSMETMLTPLLARLEELQFLKVIISAHRKSS